MTDKIELPGGNWARLRDPEDVPEYLRRPIVRVQERLLGSELGDAIQERQAQGEKLSDEETAQLTRKVLGTDDWEGMVRGQFDVNIVALVEEWSYKEPVTVESLLHLPGRAYKLIRKTCDPLLQQVVGDTTDEDIENPTQPGGDSLV